MKNTYLERAEKAIQRAQKFTGKENSVKESAFCGPGDSFPVNDCAQFTASLRLISKSKYSSSTKNRIRASINRRGKKLGCKGAKKARALMEESGINVADIINLPIFKLTLDLVEYSIDHPGGDL